MRTRVFLAKKVVATGVALQYTQQIIVNDTTQRHQTDTIPTIDMFSIWTRTGDWGAFAQCLRSIFGHFQRQTENNDDLIHGFTFTLNKTHEIVSHTTTGHSIFVFSVGCVCLSCGKFNSKSVRVRAFNSTDSVCILERRGTRNIVQVTVMASLQALWRQRKKQFRSFRCSFEALTGWVVLIRITGTPYIHTHIQTSETKVDLAAQQQPLLFQGVYSKLAVLCVHENQVRKASLKTDDTRSEWRFGLANSSDQWTIVQWSQCGSKDDLQRARQRRWEVGVATVRRVSYSASSSSGVAIYIGRAPVVGVNKEL